MATLLAENEVRGSGRDEAEKVRREVAQTLENAEPFWWSEELAGMAEVTSRSLPSWTLTEQDAPANSGFFWFSKPVPFAGASSDPDYPDLGLRAISWQPVLFTENPDALFMQFCFWTEHGGRLAGAPLPSSVWLWEVGSSLDTALRDAEEGGTNVHVRMARFCRFTAACWALLGQSLLVAPRERVDRGAARRLKRDGSQLQPLVRVVQLRRVEHTASHGPGGEPVEWSCRWVVRGHWRQQPYGPGQAQRRPTWIAPHVKGPDEKPLKAPQATIFAVTR
jgi:hypothetical protein